MGPVHPANWKDGAATAPGCSKAACGLAVAASPGLSVQVVSGRVRKRRKQDCEMDAIGPSGGLDPQSVEIITWVQYIAAPLGVVSSLVLLVVFALDASSFRRNLGMLFMAVAATTCFLGLSYLPERLYVHIMGQQVGNLVQADMMQFFDTAALLWSFSISLSIFLVACTDLSLRALRRYHWVFHVVNWTVSAASTAACHLTNSYGDISGLWYWVYEKPVEWSLMGPNLLFLIVSPILWWCIKRQMKKEGVLVEYAMVQQADSLINRYILVYIVTELPALVNELMWLFGFNQFVPYLLHCISQPAQGFWLLLFVGSKQLHAMHCCGWGGDRRGAASGGPLPPSQYL